MIFQIIFFQSKLFKKLKIFLIFLKYFLFIVKVLFSVHRKIETVIKISMIENAVITADDDADLSIVMTDVKEFEFKNSLIDMNCF